MRALVYTAPGRVEMEERPRPVAPPGEEEIAIQAAGVCGSDISGFLGHSALRRPPLILGHELVGRRADRRRVDANPLISCGRCNACMSGAQNLCESSKLLGLGTTPGTFAEYVALPSAQVYDIPDTLSLEQAILAEPLANIVHMLRIVAPPPFFRFAIVGAGTMGALALQASVRTGARERLAVDVNERRLATMQKLGAMGVVNVNTADGPGEALRVAGRGFDVVLDASGSAPARQMAFDLCRPGGQVVLLGMGTQRSEVDFVASIRKEHRVVMSFAYTPVDFHRALDLLIQDEINLTPWTVSLPLERGQEAMERMSHNPGVALKMIMEVANS